MSNDKPIETILIIDDEVQIRNSFKMIIEQEGFMVKTASGGMEGIDILKHEEISAVLLDLKMPQMDGMETLKKIKSLFQHIPVIIITAHGDVGDAVAAIKIGAYDFVLKPPDFDKLLITIERAVREQILRQKIVRLNKVFENTLEDILGRGKAIKKVIDDITTIANTNISIIIQGETGSGKSFLARQIHKFSSRSDRPFVEMDVGSLTESLIESELFGHVKGSFTGAELNKKGFFEAANSGTLFIDELQNMSLNVQTKFLGVLENKSFYQVGASRPLDLDVRLIIATNKDISSAINSGRLREDLFYRLNEYIITIPPLRERKDDLEFFIEIFIAEFGHEYKKSIKTITPKAMDMLLENPWNGNIRELKNTIRRIVLSVINDTIDVDDVLSVKQDNNHGNLSSNTVSLKDSVMKYEIQCIINALKETGGNKTKAASKLKITYRGLLKKMEKLGISDR